MSSILNSTLRSWASAFIHLPTHPTAPPSAALGAGTPGGGAGGASDGTTIFVKGYDKYLGEEEVRKQLTEAFAPYGAVQNIRLPTDRETGELKGIGYIEFATVEEKNAAAELDGAEAAGGWLKVDVNPGPPGGAGGGRGGGFGGGGFGGGGVTGSNMLPIGSRGGGGGGGYGGRY